MNRDRTLVVVSSGKTRIGLVLVLLLGIAFAGQGAATTARAEDSPKLVKTRIFVKLWQNHSYWPPKATQEQYDTTSWLPDVRFRVIGPIAGGSQLAVDVNRPDGSLWVSLDCPTAEIGADRWLDVETPRDPPGGTKLFTTATGVYGFNIRLKNALTGQNQTLYSGKFKVGKVDKSKGIPKFKNTFTYYVDHDWTLPLGFVWAQPTQAYNVHLTASMWFKGTVGQKAAYLFYKGKQVASTKESGSDNVVIELNTFDNDTADPRWERIDFTWYSANFTAPEASTHPSIFFLDKNPGDYEVKVLCGGALCREAKFSIGTDGKIVDNGLVAANKLNITSVMIPVKVVGTADGQWQPMAWKTDTFYGNPLQGFTAP
ncbi:MAG TPA: hypothetical protein VF656_03975 [Pyrinomonadaceae bacterium]|jgi:hypothetical protein